MPTAATEGWLNTAWATLLWSIAQDLPPKTVSAKAIASLIATGRQGDAIGAVADRVDVVHRGLGMAIDPDHAALVEIDPGRLQAHVMRVGPAAGGIEDLIDIQNLAAGQLKPEMRAMRLDRRDLGLQAEIDALLLELLGHETADIVIEAAQQRRAAIEEMSLGAETVEDAGELQRDIAAAHHRDALRQMRQVERLVGGDGMLDAGMAGRSGLPPVATRIIFAVTRRPSSSTVCGATTRARASITSTLDFLSRST